MNVLLFLASLMIFSIFDVYGYPCNSSISNQSAEPWTFKFRPDVNGGNVYFSQTGKINCPQNGPCTIPACTNTQNCPKFQIQYADFHGTIEGTVYITDYKGITKSFYYVNKNNVPYQCPYVYHSGDTGSVSINTPSDGDFTIGQNHW